MAKLNKNLNNFFNNNKFLGSFQSFKDIPYSDIKKECCFIGRSNVGKSSLINSLTKTKKPVSYTHLTLPTKRIV